MRTEEFECRADAAHQDEGITCDELYNDLASLPKKTDAKTETLPLLTLTDSSAGAKARDTDASKPGTAESAWLASLKPKELEAATNAFKEMGIKASSPAEIAVECKKLVGVLASDEFETREKAKEALRKIGSAALPALLNGMASEDPHVRRECSRMAEPMLRPAHALIDAQYKLQEMTGKDKTLQEDIDQTRADEKRLALRKQLLSLPDSMTKDEAESLKRVKELVTGMEKETSGRKTGATEHERAAIGKLKDRIAEQEEAAHAVKSGMSDMLARTAGLMADPVVNRNGVNLKELGATIKRALATGAKPDNEHIQAAMARVIQMGGKNPMPDVVAAFKKAGGDITTLPPADTLDELGN